MSRTKEIQEVPQKFNEEGNPITVEEGSKMGASNAPTLEDLMKRLEKLTAENNKLRRKIKAKRTKGSSSSSEEEDSSNKEDVSKKGKKGTNNHDKPSYNSLSFSYDNMASTTVYTSIPIGKPPYFDGTCYNY
jgi:septal ring factor EnvC (AmiA/AmiB activator)